MTRLAPLVQAVRTSQSGAPLSNPVTVLCMPGSRDDILLALSREHAHANVRVLTLPMLVKSQFPHQLDSTEIGALVTHALQELPEDSLIRQKGLAEEPATRVGVRIAVEKLLRTPRELWSETGPRTLPREIEKIAERIAEHADRVLPYQAWELTTIPENTIVWDVVGTNPAEDRLLAHLPNPLRAATPAEQKRLELADEHTQALAVLSLVREHLATNPLHKIGVALLRPEFGPLLLDAAEDLPIQLRSTSTMLEEPVTATLLALLSLDIDDMPRVELATALQRGCVTWTDAHKNRPTLHSFDSQSRKKNSPRAWPAWEVLADKTEGRWIASLRNDLLQVRNTASWSEFADQALELAKAHVREPIPAMLFDGLRAYDGLGIEYSFTAAVEALHEAASNYHQTEPPTEGLRVGTLASFVGCDLDTLIVCNASASCLPHAVQEEPGLSWEQLGTSITQEMKRQEDIFAAALRAAKNVIFLHPKQLTGGEFGGTPSLWTLQASLNSGTESSDFPLSNQRQINFLGAVNGRLPAITQQADSVLSDRKDGNPKSDFNGFIEDQTNWINGHEFSASALDLYIKSPYLFFAKYVAKMHELEADPADDLEKRDQGTIVHAIIEEWTNRVWLTADPRPASAEHIDWDAAYALLLELVEKHLAEDVPPTISALAKLSFEAQARHFLDRWFAEEQARAADGWIPIGAEMEFGKDRENQVEITTLLGPIYLYGKIDRVEFHPRDGKIRVVDYKTGRNKLKPQKTLMWDDPDAFSLQPFFYGLAIHEATSSGWIQRQLDDAGISYQQIQPQIDIHFYYLFKEEEKDRNFQDVYGEAEHGIFWLFLNEIFTMLVSGMFYPREIDPGMWGHRNDVIRLGSNNYARQATAVKDWLFAYFQKLVAEKGQSND